MTPAPRRILVADDEPSIRDLLSSVFTLWGYPVRLCADGAAALAAATDPAIGLLVVDLMMPQATGLEVLRQLRASGCRTPAILMSGHFPKETAAACRELGDVDQLEKPFSLADLKAVVTARLGPRKA
jgi:two-component system OmpR family response regulator